jgi:hypothetical protein
VGKFVQIAFSPCNKTSSKGNDGACGIGASVDVPSSFKSQFTLF